VLISNYTREKGIPEGGWEFCVFFMGKRLTARAWIWFYLGIAGQNPAMAPDARNGTRHMQWHLTPVMAPDARNGFCHTQWHLRGLE